MSDPSNSDLHTAWSRLFVASLASAGVRDVVLSPGSRSTPLALAASAEPRLRLHILVDERTAAFFALGQARISGRPSVMICTSGTAAAHFLPALIEASQSHIPLIALTADRPWEAYDCASSQTVDQVKLFGDCVRHYADLGLPDSAPSALAAVVRIAAQAVHRSTWPSPGPVHVNARFRKPLEPIEVAQREPFCDRGDRLLAKGPPRTFVSSDGASMSSIDLAALQTVALLCRERARGVLVCGPAWCGSDAAKLRRAVAALSARTGFAVWAEATSGVRFGGGPDVQGGFDAFLRSAPLAGALSPQLIIELGCPPVSSAYARFLSQQMDCVRVVVAPHGWNDPSGLADVMIWADPATLCQALTAHPLLPQEPPLAHADDRRAFRALLHRADAAVWSQVQQAQQAQPDGSLSEGAIAATLVDALPNGATLVVGNSLAVRDLDLFCPATDKALRVVHQRGAAGIDGLLAGSAGTRSLSNAPLALLVGDLSALHDLGGLAALQQVPGPLVVVVVNNQGGRIFEELPLARSAAAQPQLERLFITPQHVDFMAAASTFAIQHQRVTDRAALQAALSQGLSMSQPLLIECQVPQNDGQQRRTMIRQGVVTAAAAIAAQAPPPAWATSTARDQAMQPLTIFLHGFLGVPAQWTALQDRLNRPSVALCLPGHGADPWCPGDDFDSVVDALLARLPASESGYELVGYSMGARMALALALRAPRQMRSMTLIGVDPGFAEDAGSERAARVRWEDQWAEAVHAHGITQLVESWQTLPIFASQRDLDPSVLAAQRQQRLSHRAEAITWVLRVLGTGRMPNLWARLPRLRAPLRVVSGALDDKFVQIGRRLQDCVPNASHIILPNVGHNVVLEAPELLLNILRTPYGHIEQRQSQETR